MIFFGRVFLSSFLLVLLYFFRKNNFLSINFFIIFCFLIFLLLNFVFFTGLSTKIFFKLTKKKYIICIFCSLCIGFFYFMLIILCGNSCELMEPEFFGETYLFSMFSLGLFFESDVFLEYFQKRICGSSVVWKSYLGMNCLSFSEIVIE